MPPSPPAALLRISATEASKLLAGLCHGAPPATTPRPISPANTPHTTPRKLSSTLAARIASEAGRLGTAPPPPPSPATPTPLPDTTTATATPPPQPHPPVPRAVVLSAVASLAVLDNSGPVGDLVPLLGCIHGSELADLLRAAKSRRWSAALLTSIGGAADMSATGAQDTILVIKRLLSIWSRNSELRSEAAGRLLDLAERPQGGHTPPPRDASRYVMRLRCHTALMRVIRSHTAALPSATLPDLATLCAAHSRAQVPLTHAVAIALEGVLPTTPAPRLPGLDGRARADILQAVGEGARCASPDDAALSERLVSLAARLCSGSCRFRASEFTLSEAALALSGVVDAWLAGEGSGAAHPDLPRLRNVACDTLQEASRKLAAETASPGREPTTPASIARICGSLRSLAYRGGATTAPSLSALGMRFAGLADSFFIHAEAYLLLHVLGSGSGGGWGEPQSGGGGGGAPSLRVVARIGAALGDLRRGGFLLHRRVLECVVEGVVRPAPRRVGVQRVDEAAAPIPSMDLLLVLWRGSRVMVGGLLERQLRGLIEYVVRNATSISPGFALGAVRLVAAETREDGDPARIKQRLLRGMMQGDYIASIPHSDVRGLLGYASGLKVPRVELLAAAALSGSNSGSAQELAQLARGLVAPNLNYNTKDLKGHPLFESAVRKRKAGSKW